MKRIVFSLAVSALALGAAAMTAVAPTVAQAQQGNGAQAPGGGQRMFTQMDADSNGVVSLEEFQARMATRFQALDADGDGAVTAEEMQAARGQGGIGGMQASRHGKQERMQRFGSRKHGHGDWDGKMRQVHVRPGMEGMMRDGMRMHGTATPEMRQQRAERTIQMRDTNGDGLLSVEELSAEMNADTMFARADTDGDGAISKAEFDAMRQMFGNPGGVTPEDLQ